MNSTSSPPLGILGSSGGSAMIATAECLIAAGRHRRWVVLTDRPCGLLDWASSHASSAQLIPYINCESFSQSAAKYFRACGAERILMFYTRRIGEELFGSLETCNIHPSLLPDFPGLGSVRKAMAVGTDVIGATLHRVDAGLDTGNILLQVQNSICRSESLKVAERISYMQKVLLALFWQQAESGHPRWHLHPDEQEAFDRFRLSLELPTPIILDKA